MKSNSDTFTGIVAIIKSIKPDKKQSFLFRCDIDAVPITEQSEV